MSKVTITLQRKLAIAAIITAAMLCLVACRDDYDNTGRYDTGGRVGFIISDATNTAMATSRADESAVTATPTQVMPLYIGSDTLALTFTAQPNGNNIFNTTSTDDATTTSRSVPYNNTTNTVDHFTALALNNDGTTYFNTNVTVDDNGYGVTNYYWRASNLWFMAYATNLNIDNFAPTVEKTTDNYVGTFTYHTPESDGQNDAFNQPDIVFAMRKDVAKSNEPISLLFHHALSAITFKVGKMPTDLMLKRIGINNLYGAGECSFTLADTDANRINFEWIQTGQRNCNYTQNLFETAVAGNIIGTAECTFLVVPQSISAETAITLNFTIGDRKYTLTKNIGQLVDQFLPDTNYVFTISMPDEVDVDVDDTVDGIVKRDVRIQNTGITTCYIRATIVGSWVNSRGYVQEGWDETTQGTFTYGAEWNEHWKRGDDGYYYHLTPVKRDEYTYPLFDTYTLTTEADIYRNLTLELSIAAQSVPVNEAAKVWNMPTP